MTQLETSRCSADEDTCIMKYRQRNPRWPVANKAAAMTEQHILTKIQRRDEDSTHSRNLNNFSFSTPNLNVDIIEEDYKSLLK